MQDQLLVRGAMTRRNVKLRGGTTPFIANLCTIWRQVVSFSPRSVYCQWKTPRTHWVRSLVGHQHRPGRVIEEN